MPGYLNAITPDSLSGVLFALEGVGGAVTLLNGPTGCKFYHSAISDAQLSRGRDLDPLSYPEELFFGQPRVPCTYLDNDDYVYGSADKLESAIKTLAERAPFELLAIVNSPGAALIGDDVAGIAARALPGRPITTVETPGFSAGICAGHETAALALVGACAAWPSPPRRPETGPPPTGPRVNLLGMSIHERNHTGDVAELRRLFGLVGVETGVVLCGGSTWHETRRLGDAALNVVVHAEFGGATAQALHERFGTPFHLCDGPPIGFAATEAMLREVCAALGADPGPAIADSEQARARSYAFVSRVDSVSGLPQGVPFAVEGACSKAYAYVRHLARYFGLVPVAVTVQNPEADAFRPRLEALLADLGVSAALDADVGASGADIVFASGNTIARLKAEGGHFCGVEIALPTLGYLDVTPKTHLGVAGALQLTEAVLNALPF
ncbi:MAG: nitrogenase component 1 [Propionibacteriaceae bacterium]|jgi:nitrogenase molybdenum-iron protein alpha/beta subunit|nr:nitrogenase component 1 [Propionibacteriaceae bacterium]